MRRRTLVSTLVVLLVLGHSTTLHAQGLIAELDTGRFPGTNDSFGGSCSGAADFDGDGIPEILVGAPYLNTGSTQVGRTYVFSGATASILYFLDGTDPGGEFGYRVCGLADVDGDGVGDFLVSAAFYSGTGKTDAGRVYVYSGQNGALIRHHDGQDIGDEFGSTMARIGDLDGDGTQDYMVGAPDRLVGSVPEAGRVYVYSGATGTLLFGKSGTTMNQRFGISLASVGDVDADGMDDIAIGSADSASGGGSGRGRIDVYSGGSHTKITTLIGAAPDDGSLGWSLAGDADFDGDGIPDLLVGDPNHATNGPSSGAVIVYSGSSWTPIATWLGPNTGSQFGIVATTLEDVNGDSVPDALVGTLSGANYYGTAFLFSGKTSHQLFEFKSAFQGDLYGAQVSSVNDLTGDGLTDLGLGAEWDSQTGWHSGRAYLYSGSPLFLESNATSYTSGDLIDIAWHCREPFVLTSLVLIDVLSIPTFVILDLGSADSSGERAISSTVPPGLSGIDLDLQAFATDSRQGVVSSSILHLVFS